MGLTDFFKKKKDEPVAKPAPKTEVKKEARPKDKPATVKTPKKATGFSHKVLKEPHVTEKATDLTEKNQYVFKVFLDVNKKQVKKAVEEIYSVDVESVNIINSKRKRRRVGRSFGWKEGYKKAIVKLRGDQKIEVLPR